MNIDFPDTTFENFQRCSKMFKDGSEREILKLALTIKTIF